MILEDEAVLGVPGPYTWRGTVHTANISDDYLFKVGEARQVIILI